MSQHDNSRQPQGTLTGKTCLITGATNGIGYVTALAIAQQGATLYVVARNREKAEHVMTQLRDATNNPRIHLLVGDLASLTDVRRIAAEFLATGSPLHLLVNNAGVVNTKREVTVDGFETMFAVNHLAHFLLTLLLLDRIRKSAPARIVIVGSDAHAFCDGLKLDDLQSQQSYAVMKTYGHSKLCNLLFMHELSKRLAGSGVTVNACHPGAVATGLGAQNGWMGKVMTTLLKPFFRTPQKGAATSIWLATSPEVADKTGQYFADCRVKRMKRFASDDAAAAALWKASEALVGVMDHG